MTRTKSSPELKAAHLLQSFAESPAYFAVAFETVSRLYAKQLIPTFFIVVTISIYASFPFTSWNSVTGSIVPKVASWPQ